jgi:hypothetical protein
MLKLFGLGPSVLEDLQALQPTMGQKVGHRALTILTEFAAASNPSIDKDTLARALHSPYSSVRAAAARNLK